MTRFLITTLAEYQTRFWLEVGLQLRRLGHEVAFLSFDDRSSEMLNRAGLSFFSATDPDRSAGLSTADVDATLARFDIADVHPWLAHERFAFGLRDTQAMRRRLAAALLAADDACKRSCAAGPAVMVQELGGFLSVIGSYFAARRHGMDNWFVEPSFFRGRMFFLRNSFSAISIEPGTDEVPVEVDRYLDDTLRTGAIVVPEKDRHQYTTARRKIINWRNARRLLEKVVDKHVHGKRQEFGHIGSHVATHARMLLNSRRLRHRYTPIRTLGRYVYYPLHVPGDMALTLRTPHLLDQLALIDFLCRSVPSTHQVAIKEHPAMVGAVDAARLGELLDRYDHLVLVPPSTNNYEVLRSAEAIVSINSKSGAEAGLVGKSVLVLGDAFYRDAPFAVPVHRLQDLPSALAAVLRADRTATDPAAVRRYFGRVWRQTLPGELYVADAANVATFTDSLVAAVS